MIAVYTSPDITPEVTPTPAVELADCIFNFVSPFYKVIMSNRI